MTRIAQGARLLLLMALLSCGASPIDVTSGTPSPVPSTPTPTIESPPPDPVYAFSAPDIIGMTLKEAKAAINDALVDASIDDTVRVAVSIWSDRESKKPVGTILAVHKPKGYRAGAELSMTADSSQLVVRTEISVVIAKAPIRFHGDSIYVGGTGSAMITWLDSNFNIHQQTLSLPAWFAVPQGIENYNAQRQLGDNGEIICELRYDDETYARSKSSGPYSICSVSA